MEMSLPYMENSENLLAQVAKHASEAIIVVDERQRITLVNQGTEEIFGYDAHEIIGKPLDVLIPFEWRELHRAHVERFARGKVSARYMNQRRQIFGRRKSGEVFPSEASVVKISGGQRTVFAAILRELDERAADERSETFTRALEQAGDVVFIANHEGVIEYVNPAFEQVTGYLREEALGNTPRLLKSGLMSAEYYKQVWDTILSGKVFRAETLNRKKNGELFYYDQTISPLKDSRGRVTHFVSTGKDVTLQRRMEQEIQLLLKLALAVAEAESFEAALNAALKLVCETMFWDFGEAWLPSYDDSRLELSEAYYGEFEGVARFRQESAALHFAHGAGLPGKVWRLAHPLWVADVTADAEFLRAEAARQAGLVSAISIPVMAETRAVAVLEFFSRAYRPKDERMMALSAAISAQLGAVFQRKKADEALRLSEARLREAQRVAKIGNWELDLLHNRLTWSDEIFRIFEIDPDRFAASYEAFLNLVHPEDREAVHRAYTESLQNRQPYQIVHRLLMSDGRIKYVEERCETFFAPNGAPLRSVGSVQDVTARQQAERARLLSEERFKTIFERSPLGIALIQTGTGRFLEVNPMFAQITGRSKSELLLADWMSITHPDDLSLNLSRQQALLAGETNSYQMEKRCLRPDGSVVWVNLTSTLLERAEDGAATHLVMIEDVTERKRAEEALRLSEQKYRTVANFTYDWEAWRAPEGAYVYVSPSCERITGYAAEEFLQDSDLVAKIIHPADAHHLAEHRRELQMQTQKKTLETEYRILTREGETRWIRHICVPVFGERGEFLGRRENNRDVTESKLAEFALRDSQQRLREMVDSAPFGAHVFQLDEEQRLILIDANESADDIFGISHSALLGKTFEEAFPLLIRSELPQAYRRVARFGGRDVFPRFAYKNKNQRASVTLEIHVMQIAPGRAAGFFRNISELEIAYDETIVGWSRAIDLRDNETKEHTVRVTKMTVELARIIGFSEADLLYVRWGALLHDMGKIGVPDGILRKPGKLTEEEWAIMREHPRFAYEMLYPIRFLRPALDIPYCHHERWDGSGYPRGLKGVEIPLAARIFTLVDVWDALRSDRPYRKKWSRQKTIEHILSFSVSYFDPALVNVFMDFINGKTRRSE